MESSKSLKRLGFVQQGATVAQSASAQAERVYKSVRSFTATMPVVDNAVNKAEEVATASLAPIVAKAQDVGDKLLHFADDKASPRAKGLAWPRATDDAQLAKRSWPAVTPIPPQCTTARP